MANISERTCAICRTKKPKNELFRFVVANKNYSNVLENMRIAPDSNETKAHHGSTQEHGANSIVFDKDQRASGRGFYLCSEKCWDHARDKKKKIRLGSAEPAKRISLPDLDFGKITGGL